MRVSEHPRAYGIRREGSLEKIKSYLREKWYKGTSTKIENWCGGWDLNPRRPTPHGFFMPYGIPKPCPVGQARGTPASIHIFFLHTVFKFCVYEEAVLVVWDACY